MAAAASDPGAAKLSKPGRSWPNMYRIVF
jgi:hypothetical protein